MRLPECGSLCLSVSNVAKNALTVLRAPTVSRFIRMLFSFAPLLLTSVSFMVKRLYPIKSYQTILEISEGITLHLQGQSAWDPVTHQEVWIEEHSNEEQYLLYLLDQFSHSSLLWLLSPALIWKRHQENKLPLRRNTLLHINSFNSFQSDESQRKGSVKKRGAGGSDGYSVSGTRKSATEVMNNDEQTNPRTNAHGCCSCFDTVCTLLLPLPLPLTVHDQCCFLCCFEAYPFGDDHQDKERCGVWKG